MQPRAKIIADSVSQNGDRLTTMEVVFHRFVLSEMNTHRRFSRNSASSRAIPFAKVVERIEQDIAFPLSWPAEKKGMQGGDELDESTRQTSEGLWAEAAHDAIRRATQLHDLGVHKSVVNRLLEPFASHTAIISSTEWQNFWNQRCSPLAQPEIRVAAEAMREAYDASHPTYVDHEAWHMPYIDDEDWAAMAKDKFGFLALRQISAARCARVSYLTHDGQRSLEADLTLYERLVSAEPAHWSPLEHVATPTPEQAVGVGNFTGWTQLRQLETDTWPPFTA
jgi:thymidylate synthase ThyX